jgi:hypothetical protein
MSKQLDELDEVIEEQTNKIKRTNPTPRRTVTVELNQIFVIEIE